MSKTILVTFLAAVAAATADPLVFRAPLVASPYSAAYISPASAGVVAPVAQAAAPLPAAVPAALPAAYPAATVPFSSVSAYSYGSSYSVQDYFPAVVNPNPSLAYSAAYSLPYAYAADYYYRR